MMLSRLYLVRSITFGPASTVATAIIRKQPLILWSTANPALGASNNPKQQQQENNTNLHHSTKSISNRKANIKNVDPSSSNRNNSNSNDDELQIKKLDKDQRATMEQLTELEARVQEEGRNFFQKTLNSSYYTKDLLFINNIRNIRTTNLAQYVMQINLVKAYYAINYTTTRCELLNLVKNPEESYIRIRWRFISRPGLFRIVLTFWKFIEHEKWTDGISTLYVNRDGKVYCHVCDTIDVDLNDLGHLKRKKSLKERLMDRSGVSV